MIDVGVFFVFVFKTGAVGLKPEHQALLDKVRDACRSARS